MTLADHFALAWALPAGRVAIVGAVTGWLVSFMIAGLARLEAASGRRRTDRTAGRGADQE